MTNSGNACGRAIRAAALLATCLAGGVIAPAHAQDAAAPQAASGPATPAVEDIVVTAQHRSERLQDVPIAISALNSTSLSSHNVTDLGNLAGAVPGLAVSGFAAVNASNLISIRGITGQPLPIGAGQATAVYLDGVYLARPDAAFFGLDDVERVEVLRGPQGTLYGRNATAGAINIVTREPGQTRHLGFDVSTGNYGAVSARGSISGPLSEWLALGLSGSFEHHDGYFTNTVTGHKLGAQDSATVRGKLRFGAPGSAFDATLSVDFSRVHATPPFKDPYVSNTTVYQGMGNPNEVSIDAGSEAATLQRITSRGAALTMNYHASDHLDLVSITSGRKLSTTTIYDGDGTALPLILSDAENTSTSFSQEVRAVFKTDRFRATVGGNYFYEKAFFALSALAPSATPNLVDPIDRSRLNAWALFGQVEYDLTSQLTLVGGLRYNNENRDFSIDYSHYSAAGLLTIGSVHGDIVIPSAGINYKVTPGVLLYAKASEGYQAPGFNFSPGPAAAANTFKAETLWAYEVGIKSEFLDHRATLNVAGFYDDYKNIQVRSVVGVGLTSVDNAASATLKGVEASLTVRPAKGLTLEGHFNYLDTKYGKFCQFISAGAPQNGDPLCSAGYADRSGNRLNLAPAWSGGTSLAYTTPLRSGNDLTVNVDYAWESNSYFTTANEAAASTGGWNKLGGRIALGLGHGAEIYVYGRNLTNKRYIDYAARLTATLEQIAINDPRTYGVGLKYRF